MRFFFLAGLVVVAYWQTVRVGSGARSARVGVVLVSGLTLRLAVSLLSTHNDLVGNTADPTTYEVNSNYLSAGWHVASSVQPPATIGKNLAMVVVNALIGLLPGSPSLHTSTALVATVASSVGIALVVGASHRALYDLAPRARNTVVFRTALLCSIVPSILYATSQNFKEAYQILGMGLILDAMSRYLSPRRFFAPLRLVVGAAIVGATRPVLVVLVPMFVVLPFVLRHVRNRARSTVAVVGLGAALTVLLPLAAGGATRTQFTNTAALGGGSQLSLPASRVAASLVTVVRTVWATEPWFVVRSALGVLNWFESLVIGTLLAVAVVRLARSSIRGRARPYLIGLAFFTLLPSWIVAASTGNGGALVRYRAPFLVTALPLVAVATAKRRSLDLARTPTAPSPTAATSRTT